MMRIISWNVNGLRAVHKKNFSDSISQMQPDILCLQETKIQADQRSEEMIRPGEFNSYWDYATNRKGYSGVAVYAKDEPLRSRRGFGIERFDCEGRVLQLDYEHFILFNIYFPNGQKDDERLRYKLDFYRDFFAYADSLIARGKSLIITGDFNTAHNEIDLKNPQSNKDRSGFLRVERDVLDDIISRGYVDTFRYFYPDTIKYSWWSYRFNARKNNAGWRIDYFFVSRDLIDKGMVRDSFILNEIEGSDHCPVGIELAL
jgi:exodeoxyribonuclease-3